MAGMEGRQRSPLLSHSIGSSSSKCFGQSFSTLLSMILFIAVLITFNEVSIVWMVSFLVIAINSVFEIEYHSGILSTIVSLLDFEGDAIFYFTMSPFFGIHFNLFFQAHFGMYTMCVIIIHLFIGHNIQQL